MTSRKAHRRNRRRPLVEQLEDRRLLAGGVVETFVESAPWKYEFELAVVEDITGDGITPDDVYADGFFFKLTDRYRDPADIEADTLQFPNALVPSPHDFEEEDEGAHIVSLTDEDDGEFLGYSIKTDKVGFSYEVVPPQSPNWVRTSFAERTYQGELDNCPTGLFNKSGFGVLCSGFSEPYFVRLPYVYNPHGEVYFREDDRPLEVRTAKAVDKAKLVVETAYFNRPSVLGRVYSDLNANGKHDPGELGLAGYRVYQDVNGNGKWDEEIGPDGEELAEPSVLTEPSGSYLLTLAPNRGGAQLRLVEFTRERSNMELTQQPRPFVPKSSAPVKTGADFGVHEYRKVSGVVFNDTNGNGVQDEGETGRKGVRVFLDRNGDGVTGDNDCSGLRPIEPCGASDENGYFVIERLVRAGDPIVVKSPGIPAEIFSVTTPGPVFVNGNGSDTEGLAFGIFQNVQLGGQVWIDLNEDGVRNHPQEPFIGQPMDVLLDLHNDGSIDAVFRTGQFAEYTFRHVPRGTHRIIPSIANLGDITLPGPQGHIVTVDRSAGSNYDLLIGVKSGAETKDGEVDEEPVEEDPELIARKKELYNFTLDRIDELEKTNPELARNLRAYAVQIAQVEDFEPGASLEMLVELDKLVEQQRQAALEYNDWWDELRQHFGDGFEADLARLEYVWRNVEDAAAKLYLADKEKLAQKAEHSFFDFLVETKKEFELLKKDLDENSLRLLYEMVAKDLKNTNWLKTAAEMSGILAIERGMDPNLTIDQRLGNMFAGIFALVDSATLGLSAGAAGRDGVKATVRKLEAFLQKQALKDSVDPNFAQTLAKRAAEVFEKALSRARNGQAVTLADLRDGDIIPIDMLSELGYTRAQIDDMLELAEKHRVKIRTRTTNVDSARFIDNGAVTKPVDIKAKTISQEDAWLGFDEGDYGLVGVKSPDELVKPWQTAPCDPATFIRELCDAIYARYDKRLDDFDTFRKDFEFVSDSSDGVSYRHKDFNDPDNPKKYFRDDEGLLWDASTDPPRAIAGDIDPVSISDADTGQLLDKERTKTVVTDLMDSEAQWKHSTEQTIISDTVDDLRARGVEEGSFEWDESLKKARKLREKLEQAHLDGKEFVIETSADGGIRLVDQRNFAEVGEDGFPIIPPKAADVEAIVEQMGFGDGIVKKIREKGSGAISKEVEARFKSAWERINRKLDAQGEAATFYPDEVQEMSPAAFKELVDDQSNGVFIDNADGQLTRDDLLSKFSQAQLDGAEGEGEEASGVSIAEVAGGFFVESVRAAERFLDNSGDGFVSPLDALTIINFLNEQGPGPLPRFASLDSIRRDTNVDGAISPVDVLIIINFLNDRNNTAVASAEGETTTPLIAEFVSTATTVAMKATVPRKWQSADTFRIVSTFDNSTPPANRSYSPTPSTSDRDYIFSTSNIDELVNAVDMIDVGELLADSDTWFF